VVVVLPEICGHRGHLFIASVAKTGKECLDIQIFCNIYGKKEYELGETLQ
jgi:hypothetical protein